MSADGPNAPRAEAMRIDSWARRKNPIKTTRALQEDPAAWNSVWPDVIELDIIGAAVAESEDVESEHARGGSVDDLAAGLEQAAHHLVPGPLLSTALAAQILRTHPGIVGMVDGWATAGVALHPGDLRVEPYPEASDARWVTGTSGPILGAWDDAEAQVLVPARDGEQYLWFLAYADDITPVLGASADAPLATASFTDSAIEIATQTATLGDVHTLAARLAAAEARGLAQWCTSALAAQAPDDAEPVGIDAAVRLARAAVENAPEPKSRWTLRGRDRSVPDAQLYLDRALALQRWIASTA
jgi:hypothetical protein